ncbi:MAG: hypothetical protein ACLUGI_09470 [Subdoligranulum sp.]
MLDGIVVLALGAAFTITASGKSLFYGKFDNGFVRFLGKVTMPVFLSHFVLRTIFAEYTGNVQRRSDRTAKAGSFFCLLCNSGRNCLLCRENYRQANEKSWHAFCTEIIAKNK